MRFSEKYGFKPVREQLQIESIDADLLNTLWSILISCFEDLAKNGDSIFKTCNDLWFLHLKKPIDEVPTSYFLVKKEIKKYFFSDQTAWYEIYDLIEFSIRYFDVTISELFNTAFEIEKSGYRFVDGKITPITSNEEIAEIEEAVTSDAPVSKHIETALGLLSDRQTPDYRNSIKESISAVESMCCILTGKDKATLGDALKLLERDGTLHSSLKKAFSALYGYTSDDGGIRHALMDGDREIDFNEAKFMLVVCSAFVNYLKSKKVNQAT